MFRKNTLVLILVLIIFGFALWTVLPPDAERLGRQGMRLGLDLIGGVHLVYETQFAEDATSQEKTNDMKRAKTIIERRIDKYGVTEPVIQTQGTERIIVKLPGFTDIDAAKSLVAQTGFLEFRKVEVNTDGNPVYLSDYLEDSRNEFFNQAETGTRIFVDGSGKPMVILTKNEAGFQFTDESGNTIDTVTGAEYQVSIQWNSKGAKIFDEIAKYLYNAGPYGSDQRALGIFLDNALISSPQILQPAYHGSAVITGNFTLDAWPDWVASYYR